LSLCQSCLIEFNYKLEFIYTAQLTTAIGPLNGNNRQAGKA